MTSEEKIASVEAQVRLIRDGSRRKLDCPYCSQSMRFGDRPCCDLLYRLVTAVAEKLNLEDHEDVFKRIQDRAYVN